MFVGAVADNFNERIEQKIFHCEIVVDADKVKREEQAYKPIPVITDFTDADGNDRMKEMIQENYNRIRAEVRQIVADELQRIQSDPQVMHHRRKEEKVKYYSTFSSFSLRGMWTGVDGYSPFLNISTNELREIPNESEI